MEITHLFLIIALILFSTKAFSMFMRRIHLPQVIGALVAGVLLGPAVFKLATPNESLTLLAEIGVVLLLFQAGVETDFKMLKSSFKASLLISLLGIILALGGGWAVAYFFGKAFAVTADGAQSWLYQSFFIGVIIASMSTSITVEALNELGVLKTKTGTAILGASIFDDILVIMLLAVTMGIGKAGTVSVVSLGIILIKIVVFFGFAIVVGLGVNKLFNFLYNRYGARKRLSIFALAYCFLMAYLADLFGLADITGAYLAGVALCNTRCVEYLENKTHPLSYMLFTPIFLANIGINTNFDGFTMSMLTFTILYVLVSIFSKWIGCGLGAKLCNFTNRESMQVGIGMVARGEVSFVVASKGLMALPVAYISSQLYPSIIVVVLVTVLIMPLLLKSAYGDTPRTIEPEK
jgi:Kef-type K+ transport system membrane component KefB